MVLSDGSEGFSYGYDRGLPLFEICSKAALSYLGGASQSRNALRKRALGSTPAAHATMTRGASLCDIALWDAWCMSKQLPLWAALGGTRDRLPVMPIIGYGMTAERANSETASLAGEGFKIIKCMIDGRDLHADVAVMEAIAGALPSGCRFGIDAHWSWSSVAEALPWCAAAEKLGAAFIEDPFAPTRVHAVRELAERIHTPLALGEDVIDLHGFRDVTAVAGIVRVDASVSGGISGIINVMGLAGAYSRPVIPHVFLPLHAHLGFADDAVMCTEMISPSVAADPIDGFFLISQTFEHGDLLASDTPGAGLALDWQRLVPHFTRQESLKL